MGALAESEARLGRGDRAGALAALLTLWRARRDPRIADVIDRLSGQLLGRLQPLAGTTQKALLESWLAVDDAHEDASLGQLLPDLFAGTSKMVRARLERLAARPDDSRIGRALVEQVVEHWVDLFENPVGTAVWKLLGRHGDPGMLASLRASPFGSDPDLADTEWRAWRLGQVASAVAKLPHKPLATDEQAQLEALAARLGDSAGQTLLASAGDAAARLVAADRLQEEGDPRGELIALQHAARDRPLTRTERARVDSLVHTHARTWLGPLARVLDGTTARFEEGVVVQATLQLPDRIATVLGAPEWATVRDLDLDVHAAPIELLRRWPHITTVRVASREAFAALLEARPPLPLEALLFTEGPQGGKTLSAEDQQLLEACAGLPRLRHLGVSGVYNNPRSFRSLWAAAPRLDEVTVFGHPSSLAEWRTELHARAPNLEALNLESRIVRCTLRLTRDGDRRLAALSATLSDGRAQAFATLVKAVSEFKKGALSTFTLVDTPELPGPKKRAPLLAVLDRLEIAHAG